MDPSNAASAPSLVPVQSGRLPPQNLDAERSVLGGILLDNQTINDVLEVLRPDDFYRMQHRKVFEACCDLTSRSEPIDVVVLAEELRKKGELDSVGGAAFLAALDAAVPTAGNVAYYARIVKDKSIARRLIDAAHAIESQCYEQVGNIDEFLDEAEARIFEVTEHKPQSSMVPIKDVLKRSYGILEKLYEKQEEVTGIPTGFLDLDRMLSGLQRGDLIIVAGRPSMGKTAFALNVASNVAFKAKQPVGVFSLEMGAEQLALRMISGEARVDSQKMRTGKLVDSDWAKLARSVGEMAEAKMFIDDSGSISALDLRARARRLKAKMGDLGLGLIVIDYLQLMKGRGNKSDNREQEISEISRGLKSLAKELDVPVMALSQLNRSLEKREDKRPVLSDLRESGAIEQDADVILFIHREEAYLKDKTPEDKKGVAEIIVGKQRNGPTGIVEATFLREYTKFENRARDQYSRE